MSTGQMQHALREMRGVLSDPRAWVTLLGVSLALGLAGPFGTDQNLSLLPRCLYWMAIVFGTFKIGVLMSVLTEPWRLGRPIWVALTCLAVLDGIMVSVWLFLLNGIVYGIWPDQIGYALLILVNATVVSGIVVVIFHVFKRKTMSDDDTVTLLDRLPFDKRGAIISLSVQDHYTDIRTTKGSELILMRLSDAMREVGATTGLQVHRSHWVALSQVTSASRTGDRAELTMSDGTVIPVSRSYIPAVRDAGLLPKGRG